MSRIVLELYQQKLYNCYYNGCDPCNCLVEVWRLVKSAEFRVVEREGDLGVEHALGHFYSAAVDLASAPAVRLASRSLF
jgi:hypothetical protein